MPDIKFPTLACDLARNFDLGALEQIGRAAALYRDTMRHYSPDATNADLFAELADCCFAIINLAETGER